MNLTFISYVSSGAIHMVMIVILSLWMAYHKPVREVIFSNITVISDGAQQGNTAVDLKSQTPLPSPKTVSQKITPPKAEPTVAPHKQNTATTPLPDKDAISAAKPEAREQGKSPAPNASADQSQPGHISTDSNPNAQPGGSKTMVGPVFSRAIRNSVYPEYPDWAQKQGIQTEVVLKFYVNADGNVIDIESEKQSGYPRLDYICREALRRWSFDPLPKDFVQTESQWGRVLFKFRLQ